MNRRTFLQRFGIGLGAAAALAAVPVATLETLSVTDAGQICAVQYLRDRFMAYTRGRTLRQLPTALYVSPGLFDAFAGELTAVERFVPADGAPFAGTVLMFKGTPLIEDSTITRWSDLRFEDPRRERDG